MEICSISFHFGDDELSRIRYKRYIFLDKSKNYWERFSFDGRTELTKDELYLCNMLYKENNYNLFYVEDCTVKEYSISDIEKIIMDDLEEHRLRPQVNVFLQADKNENEEVKETFLNRIMKYIKK